MNCDTEEIILIDDFSSFDYLEEKLENEVSRLPKVKLIRNKKREGLIRTRLIGSKIAKGKTITFLECHIECNEGWLEPLLDQIAENEMIYAIPVITVIDNKTFEFKHNPESDPQIGIFDWNMGFNWASIPEDSSPNLTYTGTISMVLDRPNACGAMLMTEQNYRSCLNC